MHDCGLVKSYSSYQDFVRMSSVTEHLPMLFSAPVFMPSKLVLPTTQLLSKYGMQIHPLQQG